jgi:hypothetical protein
MNKLKERLMTLARDVVTMLVVWAMYSLSPANRNENR